MKEFKKGDRVIVKLNHKNAGRWSGYWNGDIGTVAYVSGRVSVNFDTPHPANKIERYEYRVEPHELELATTLDQVLR